MEKEKRLLYFFLLMINGKKANRSELIRKTMRTSRTISRDMDSINRFFTDPELPWYDSNTQIRLIGKNDNAYYQLENNSFNYDSYATLGLLLSIKSLTPKIHSNVDKLFKQLISNGRAEDRTTLMSVLNHFSIRDKAYDGNFPGQELMMLQKALIKEKMIGFKQKSTNKYIFATPHSLMYMNYDYWFTYDLGGKFYDIKVRDLSDIYIDENYSKKKSEVNELLTVRVHKNISNELIQLYDVQYKRSLNEEEAKFVAKENDWLIFEIACTKLDAFYIAYQKAPYAQILAPQTYVDGFLERMSEIFNQYDTTTCKNFIIRK